MLGFNLSPARLFLFVQIQFKEMGQGMEKHFIKANTRVANKHMKILLLRFLLHNANECPYSSQYPLPMHLIGWPLRHLLGWCRWDEKSCLPLLSTQGMNPPGTAWRAF